MGGMHSVFILYAPLIGLSLIAASLVKDRGVAEKDASAEERRTVESGSGLGELALDERNVGVVAVRA